MGCLVVSFPILQCHKLEFIVYLQTVEVAWSFKTKRRKGNKIVEDEPVLSGAAYGTLRAKTGKAMKLG